MMHSSRRRSCRVAWVIAAAGAVFVASGGHAADPLPTFAAGWSDGGSSSRDARREALDELPLERIPAAARQSVERTIRGTTLYRRLPVQSFTCNAALLDFALSHPEAIVDVWRVLGISRLALDPAGPAQWRLADGYGTVGALRLVHHEPRGRGGLFVYHGRGGYSGSLTPKPLSGSCLILVRHEPRPAGDGMERQMVRIDAFLDVEGMGLELVTRTLQPLIVRSAAANLEEICIFMETLSTAAARNPAGIERLVSRLSRTDPADRATFVRITRAAGNAAVRDDDPAVVQAELAARWLPAEGSDSRIR